MRRPNAIVVGVVGVGALVLGLELYAFRRGGHRHDGGTPEGDPIAPIAEAEQPPPSPPPARLPVARPIAAPPVAPAPAEVAPMATVPEPPGDGGVDGGMGAVERRHHLIAERRRQVTREADERVFETLKMAEETRVAIRRINEDYDRSTKALENLPLPGTSPDAVGNIRQADLNAEQTRHAAINALLGDGATAFYGAERNETKSLRNQHRAEWMRTF